MSRIVLATLGSLGDLHPYLALGRALKNRGHNVAVATSLSYQLRVERASLEYFPLCPDLARVINSSAEVARRAHNMRDGTEYVLKTLVLPYIEQTYEDLLTAFRGADLVVNHAVLFPTPLAAEKLNVKWVSLILSPGIFLSAYDPPVLPPLAWFNSLRHLGPAPHRILHRFIDHVTHRWMTPVHRLRARAGLPRTSVNPVTAGLLSPIATLALFSRVLGEPQSDWPEHTEVTGFAFYDDESTEELDANLHSFLDAGEPPVVFTLGTDAVTDAGAFYEQSLQAVQKLGCRAVFLTGYDERNRFQHTLPEGVVVREYAPYTRLFARACAVVHSGGIGTIAQTLRAGVPMLVVPFAADQPDNGARVARRGLGRCIWRDRYNADRAAKLIRELLLDMRYRERTQEAQRHILTEDGVGRACSMLEWAISGLPAWP